MFDDAPAHLRDRSPAFKEETDLVAVGPDYHNREATMERETAAAWHAMRETAANEGVELLLISAFRSVKYQAGIVRRKRDAGQSWEEILRVSAYPGFSEHHTGRALDLGSPDCPGLVEDFENTTAFGWLEANASRFGFKMSYPRGNDRGVIYEPWHWFFTGSG